MKKTIKYIISIGASGFLVKVFDYIPWNKVFKGENWQWLLIDRFNWLHAILFIIAFAIIFVLLSLVDLKKYRINKKQEKLRRIDHIDLFNGEVSAQWEVCFDSDFDNDPHPINIKLFCNKHNNMGMPILIKNGVCPACQEEYEYDVKAIEAYIESFLLSEWTKIK